MLAAHKCGEEGWILILLDADDDCPRSLGAETLKRAQTVIPHRRLSVVLANKEFEAWFIAAAPSLEGQRGFALEGTVPINAETPRNAKGWLEDHMSGSYKEVLDQPAFTALFDLQQAFEGSRSFRKLFSEWQKHIQERV